MSEVSIHQLVPDPTTVLALEPEELAGVILQYLNLLPSKQQEKLNRYNFSLPYTVRDYPHEFQHKISQALMEAWVWLEREGLLAPKPGAQGEWVFITRRGKKLTTPEDWHKYSLGDLLPKQQLHARIAQKVWATFLRGDYETAVFQAFKEVEVRVRTVGRLPNSLVGTDLMRKAFDSKSVPLTELSQEKGERDALAHLFAGAIGRYRNSTGHRTVTMEAQEAVEVIVLASHLLGIVDKRSHLP